MGKYKIYIDTTDTAYKGSKFEWNSAIQNYYSTQGQIGTPERPELQTPGINNSKQVITLKEGQKVGISDSPNTNYPPFSYLDNNIGSLTTDLHLNSFRVYKYDGSGNGLIDRLPQDLRRYMLNNDEHYNKYTLYTQSFADPNYSNIKRNMNSIRGCESMFNYGATAFGSFITIPKVDSIGNVIKGNDGEDTYNVDNKSDNFSQRKCYVIYNKRITADYIEHYNIKAGEDIIMHENGPIGFTAKDVYLILDYDDQGNELKLTYYKRTINYEDIYYLVYSNTYGLIWAQINDIQNIINKIKYEVYFSYLRNNDNYKPYVGGWKTINIILYDVDQFTGGVEAFMEDNFTEKEYHQRIFKKLNIANGPLYNFTIITNVRDIASSYYYICYDFLFEKGGAVYHPILYVNNIIHTNDNKLSLLNVEWKYIEKNNLKYYLVYKEDETVDFIDYTDFIATDYDGAINDTIDDIRNYLLEYMNTDNVNNLTISTNSISFNEDQLYEDQLYESIHKNIQGVLYF